MGLLGSLIKASVKTVLTPLAVVEDIIDVTQGNKPTTTKNTVKSIVKDLDDAVKSAL